MADFVGDIGQKNDGLRGRRLWKKDRRIMGATGRLSDEFEHEQILFSPVGIEILMTGRIRGQYTQMGTRLMLHIFSTSRLT